MVLQQTLQLRQRNDAFLREAERSWAQLWEVMEVGNLDARFRRWYPTTSAVAGVTHGLFANQANAYLRQLGLPSGAVPQLNLAQFATSMHVTAVGAVKAAIARGESPERAMAIGRSLSFGAYSRYLQDGQRSLIMGSALVSERTPGWRRVGVGGCDFCRMLIGRGAVYSQATANFLSHDRCRCSAEPALDDSSPFIEAPPQPDVLAVGPAEPSGVLSQQEAMDLFRRNQEVFQDLVDRVSPEDIGYDDEDLLVQVSPGGALSLYMSEGGDYSYEITNAYLRAGLEGLSGDEDVEGIKTIIKAMDRLFRESAVVSPADQWVTRGVGRGLDETLEGRIIAEPAFTSTTVDPTVSKGFGTGGWMMSIKIPKGTRYVQGSGAEREIILNRGTKFLVRRVDSENKTVEMEVLS